MDLMCIHIAYLSMCVLAVPVSMVVVVEAAAVVEGTEPSYCPMNWE